MLLFLVFCTCWLCSIQMLAVGDPCWSLACWLILAVNFPLIYRCHHIKMLLLSASCTRHVDSVMRLNSNYTDFIHYLTYIHSIEQYNSTMVYIYVIMKGLKIPVISVSNHIMLQYSNNRFRLCVRVISYTLSFWILMMSTDAWCL